MIQPVLFPPFTELFAVQVAPPVALLQEMLQLETVTEPLDLLRVCCAAPPVLVMIAGLAADADTEKVVTVCVVLAGNLIVLPPDVAEVSIERVLKVFAPVID
jgi:hypothetical protein